MGDVALEWAIVFFLILANGAFALSEIAIVSARKALLKERADRGDRKAAAALELARSPDRFLPTVQIGITIVGVCAGALGGATIADAIAALLEPFPALAPYDRAIGIGAVVLSITYLTLVLGELVPKRIALAGPERVASSVAMPMRALVRLASPVAWILTVSSSFVLRLIGIRPSGETPVTDEEIKVLMAQGTESGAFEPAELDLVGRVLRLADRHVASVMTPRNEVVWIDLDLPPDERVRVVRESGRTQFPVARGHLDAIVGVLKIKDWLRAEATAPGDDPSLLEAPVFVHETVDTLDLLERFQSSRQHVAIVLDEHGAMVGIVTLHDVLEAIVGDLPFADEPDEPLLIERDDGSWLVDGSLPIAEFKTAFRVEDLPEEAERHFHTVGGLAMTVLRRVPRAGDKFEISGLKFEIMDMDGKRVDKVLVTTQG
jgi:putative hemolysin